MNVDWRQLNGDLSTDSRVRRKGVAEVALTEERERGRKTRKIVLMTNQKDHDLAFKLNGPNTNIQRVVGPNQVQRIVLEDGQRVGRVFCGRPS